MVCGLEHSPQQLVTDIYGIIAKALAKNLAMVQFSYQLLRVFEKGEDQGWICRFSGAREHITACGVAPVPASTHRVS